MGDIPDQWVTHRQYGGIMTLRRLLHSLVADDAARAEMSADPAGVLARAGFEGLDEQLLGTALVHHVDAAPIEEAEALVPLLERFAPLPDHPRGTPDHADPDEVDPEDEEADHELASDIASDVDPGLLFDDLRPDGPALDEAAIHRSDDAPTPTDESDQPGGDPAFGTGAVPVIEPGTPRPAGMTAPVDDPQPVEPPGIVDPPPVVDPPPLIEPPVGADDHSAGQIDADEPVDPSF